MSGKQLGRDDDLAALRGLKDGQSFYFSMFEGGGAMAQKCINIWVLFQIPQYGGEPQYAETFRSYKLNELLDMGESWI